MQICGGQQQFSAGREIEISASIVGVFSDQLGCGVISSNQRLRISQAIPVGQCEASVLPPGCFSDVLNRSAVGNDQAVDNAIATKKVTSVDAALPRLVLADGWPVGRNALLWFRSCSGFVLDPFFHDCV